MKIDCEMLQIMHNKLIGDNDPSLDGTAYEDYEARNNLHENSNLILEINEIIENIEFKNISQKEYILSKLEVLL